MPHIRNNPDYQVALRRILALLVITDGVIRDPEIAMVTEVFADVCGQQLSRAEVLAEVEAIRADPMTAARYLAKVKEQLTEYGRQQVLRGAALVSRSDGVLHAREAEMMRRLGGVMNVPSAEVERILGEIPQA